MNRLQRAAAWVGLHDGMTRDQFAQTRPVGYLDALVSKGYVARQGDAYVVTDTGHRFLDDKDGE